MNIDELRQACIRGGIEVAKFGTGKAKTLENLLEEVTTGETVLEEQGGKLVRTISVLGVNVYYEAPDGKRYRLIEEKQVFNKGSRERARKLEVSLGEKLLPGESPDEVAVSRAIREELKINDGYIITKDPSFEKKETRLSESYPGLESIYKVYRFVVQLADPAYNPNGYKEEGSEKTTYFKWIEE